MCDCVGAGISGDTGFLLGFFLQCADLFGFFLYGLKLHDLVCHGVDILLIRYLHFLQKTEDLLNNASDRVAGLSGI